MDCGGLHIEELMFVTFRTGHISEGIYTYKSILKYKLNMLVNAKEKRKEREDGKGILPLWRKIGSKMNETNV